MKNNKITKETFFYVIEDNYDEHIELAIPFYKEMHKELLALFNYDNDSPMILDLGCGTGKTSLALFEKYPKATITGIDLFNEMLSHAQNRLSKYLKQTELIQGDFRKLQFANNYDLCVSSLAMHHLYEDEKKALFQKIYDSLNSNGKFIMIDWTQFNSKNCSNIALETAVENAFNAVNNIEIAKKWKTHWSNENIPDTIENLNIWLLEANFKKVDCVFRYYGLSLIYAEK